MRTQYNEVAWLQQVVDQGFLQYEVATHQPTANGADTCNTNGYSNIVCQEYTFFSAAYGAALGPINKTDGLDYIHHAVSMIQYGLAQQNASGAIGTPVPVAPATPNPNWCGSHGPDWCIAGNMSFAFSDWGHTLEMLKRSPFYAQNDGEDQSTITHQILPKLSKGLAYLDGSTEVHDLLNDYTATNRIITHANAYYLMSDLTASVAPAPAASGKIYATDFVEEGTATTSHYVSLPNAKYPCVPANLCGWPSNSGFWMEDEDYPNPPSKSGFDSGYGGVSLRQGDYLYLYDTPATTLTNTLSAQLNGFSTWEFSRVVPSTLPSAGSISEEGNYRTCGAPSPPTDKSNCNGGVPNVNMAWDSVAWAMYYEAPYAPDNAGKTCAQYIAAARAIEYYNIPNAAGYHIPPASAAAPSACPPTYSALRQARRRNAPHAAAFADPASYGGGGVAMFAGDSIVVPGVDGGSAAKARDIVIAYSLAGTRPVELRLQANRGLRRSVVFDPTTQSGDRRAYGIVVVPDMPLERGTNNTLTLYDDASTRVDVTSFTVRRDLTELRAR